MNRPFRVVVGGILAAMGILWTLQGLGYVGGSVMSGQVAWAVIGPVVTIAGLALALWRPRSR